MALHLPIKLLCAGAALCFVRDGVVLLPEDLARLVAAKPLAAGSGGGAAAPVGFHLGGTASGAGQGLAAAFGVTDVVQALAGDAAVFFDPSGA